MNLPNKLTVLRMILVPFIFVALLLPYSWWMNLIAALIFGAASLTDMLDGKIARKYGLVTDFGKFMDPLADKFMVIAAIFGIICRSYVGYAADGAPNGIMFWTFMVMLIVTVFRELAVASIRLITAKNAGVVVAADMAGKIKTVVQIACILLALLEPVVYDYILAPLALYHKVALQDTVYALTLLTAAAAVFFTIWSGVRYITNYWKYMDPEK